MIYCIQEYSLDQDVTHIEYKKFHDGPGEIYPSITLCFYKPFRHDKMMVLGRDVTFYSYKDFLSGYDRGNWNSSFSDMDYDDVSVNFMDHLLYVEFNLLNNDYLKWNIENKTRLVDDHDTLNYSRVKQPDIYVSARLYNKKCFTMNIPFVENKRIYSVEMKI